MIADVDLRIEWLDAPAVSTPELAATWARYELWVGDRCASQVETTDRTLRRSVFGSLYPLAEWVASNWWVLNSHVRPSAIDTRYWMWPNVQTYGWLRQHNVRAAGDGMAWPDLTIVPEGAFTRLIWAPDQGTSLGPIRFASGGAALVHAEAMKEALAGIVNRVLERLAEEGLPKTRLAEEWAAVAGVDPEERAFCETVARLGVDPYSVTDEMATEVVGLAAQLPEHLLEDFFDSAEPSALGEASDWTSKALASARKASRKATEAIAPLLHVRTSVEESSAAIAWKPWSIGYAMARQVRAELNVGHTEHFDTTPWVGIGKVSASSKGIQGIVSINQGQCGLVLGGSTPLPRHASRFGQARALGRALTRPQQPEFMLSAARGYDERVAGAFAAELLAPAKGIQQALKALGKYDDANLDLIAEQFQVSPLVVRHQYDNQLTSVSY